MNNVNNNTGYHWDGKRKLSYREILERLPFDNLMGCYMLYPDNSEALIEKGYLLTDILKHCETGGEIGEEYACDTPFKESEVKKAEANGSPTVSVSKTYDYGLNDAWKLAKKLRYMDYEEKLECFGLEDDGHEKWLEIMEKFTPQETFAKLEAYEKKQAEINVGDVVTTTNGTCEYIVTNIQKPNTLHVVNTRNGYVQQMRIDVAKNTGKHIDISAILAETGKE